MRPSTRARVAGDTAARPLTTLDTVAFETPASLASCVRVSASGSREDASSVAGMDASLTAAYPRLSEHFGDLAKVSESAGLLVLLFGGRSETAVARKLHLPVAGTPPRRRRSRRAPAAA